MVSNRITHSHCHLKLVGQIETSVVWIQHLHYRSNVWDHPENVVFFMKSHIYLPPGLSQRHNSTINEHMELFSKQKSVSYKDPQNEWRLTWVRSTSKNVWVLNCTPFWWVFIQIGQDLTDSHTHVCRFCGSTCEDPYGSIHFPDQFRWIRYNLSFLEPKHFWVLIWLKSVIQWFFFCVAIFPPDFVTFFFQSPSVNCFSRILCTTCAYRHGQLPSWESRDRNHVFLRDMICRMAASYHMPFETLHQGKRSAWEP